MSENKKLRLAQDDQERAQHQEILLNIARANQQRVKELEEAEDNVVGAVTELLKHWGDIQTQRRQAELALKESVKALSRPRTRKWWHRP